MKKKMSWTPWHKVVSLRDDVRTGELSLAVFAADLHDVIMQKGRRPVYEDATQFFAFTYPTLPLRELVRDVARRLAGTSDKAVRRLELTYGGGKTHTLVTLRHIAHAPEALPDLPAIREFQAEIAGNPPKARVAALSFDKLDVEKGMEARDPDGNVRNLKHPWSVLAFQIAGSDGLRMLHANGEDGERDSAPAEQLLIDLLSAPQTEGLGTLILIDEVLMYARGIAASGEARSAQLLNFFQYLTQAVTKVDRCALVASLLASERASGEQASDSQLANDIHHVFARQAESAVQPIQKEDVAEVLRRRFFTPDSVSNAERFRSHALAAVRNLSQIDSDTKAERTVAEERFARSYPFHPDLTDIFYTRWTQLEGFQRTRGMLRVFALALRDAESWDESPLVATNVFLSAPGVDSLGDAAVELCSIATRAISEGGGNDWQTVLEGELRKARAIQNEASAPQFREVEQAVFSVFLSSQPIGQKAQLGEMMKLLGPSCPGKIEIAKALRRWTEVSWFLDDAEFAGTGAAQDGPESLPRAWRLGNQPNLQQMHDHACQHRVSADSVEDKLSELVPKSDALSSGLAGARVHRLPTRPDEIQDDGNLRIGILGPAAASESAKPSPDARRFIEFANATADRPRVNRNSILLVVPSRERLETLRAAVRRFLGWGEVRKQLASQESGAGRMAALEKNERDARQRLPEAARQAWSVVVAVNPQNEIHAFRISPGTDPLGVTIKGDERARLQDTAINVNALLPGGPYALWEGDDRSRWAKDLVDAFAANPRLPKILRREVILDTLAHGVEAGVLVACLKRPDQSVRTWWRSQLDLDSRADPALELFLPDHAEITSLDPGILAPGCLPGLWKAESVPVASVVEYFSGGRAETVERDGYEDTVFIPGCAEQEVRAAILEAVQSGSLMLVVGPVSYQGERVSDANLVKNALLHEPVSTPRASRLTPEELPDAWNGGKATALTISAALAKETGQPFPWGVLRNAVGEAVLSGWLEIGSESAPWDSHAERAGEIRLQLPSGPAKPTGEVGRSAPATGGMPGGAEIDASGLQDLAERLPALFESAKHHSLRFHVKVTLDISGKPDPGAADSINRILKEIDPDLSVDR